MHETFMRRAIAIGHDGMRKLEGGPFGAVIVKNDDIIAEGHNLVLNSHDPTAHAEIVAIRNACSKLNTPHLVGGILYTSCEPCPMCLGAIYWARLDAVYFAAQRQDAEAGGFIDSFIYDEICKPLEKRNIDMQQLLREEALILFQQWDQMLNRQTY